MLSDAQIQRVWEEMLSAEFRELYYADLATEYATKQRRATWATLILSSSAFASVIADLPAQLAIVRPVLALATAVLSGYSLAMQTQKRTVDASDLALRWSKIAHEYGAIWENVFADDAAAKLQRVDAATVEASKAGHQLPHQPKRIAKWQDRVEAKWAARTLPRAA